ncbi:MAG: DUF6599 family protein [Candidatus Acidiferrales bacterium]
MKRFLLTVLGILCIAAMSRAAGVRAALPESFGGWTSAAPSTLSSPSILNQLLGANAPDFREYVVKSVEQRSYTEGPRTASITLYRMRDPSSAYGAFTYLRQDSMSIAKNLGAFAGLSPNRALIVVGEMLLDITVPAKQARPSDAYLELLADRLNKAADRTPYPYIGEHLPEAGRIPNTVHYFLGPLSLAQFVPIGTDDWVGFDYSAEAIAAKYEVAGKDETLLIASYPTQQVAAMKFDAMLRRFTFDPPGAVPPGQTVLYGKRVSSIIAVVVGAPSQQAANTLLDQVAYESSVTWNEPKQTLTEPGIGTIVVGAFMGTGAIMLLAIAVGIGFGGFRVVMKIFLPNRVFDRDKQIEILQLGISSNPIKAKDFY